ncbi:MAG TPA: RNA pseudouridine synthase [Phycisphaerales bacterium]|nr:RNA pseudouridine synthase [Phycisphaerales bacterium]
MEAKTAKTQVEIIYQDDDIIVVNKPSGISVTKDRSGAAKLADILGEQLRHQLRGELRLVHRLDKATSGVMVLAKNVEAQTRLTNYFRNRLVKKTYLTLVIGIAPGKQGRIDAPLTRRDKKAGLMCIAHKKGKESLTHWKLLADFGSVALLSVSPVTGRTHQIRVHLPHIGLPLAIDPLYGNTRPLFLSDFKIDYRLARDQTEKPLIERLTLHAYQIQFSELEQNRPNCFIAGLDKKFTATIKMLTKYNPKGLDAFTNPDDFSSILNTQRLS